LLRSLSDFATGFFANGIAPAADCRGEDQVLKKRYVKAGFCCAVDLPAMRPPPLSPPVLLLLLAAASLSSASEPPRRCESCVPPRHSWATLPVSFHSARDASNALGEFSAADMATIAKFPLVTIGEQQPHRTAPSSTPLIH
jgi:hypothetical protein